MVGNTLIKKPWIIDFGASDHFTCDYNVLKEVSNSIQQPIFVPNGANVPVEGIRNAILTDLIILKDTLFVSKFMCNLISVSKLTEDYNCVVIFVANHYVIQDLYSKMKIGEGKRQNGLYMLELALRKTIAMKVNKANNAKLWHERLGHTSSDKMIQIKLGNDILKDNCNTFCNSCVRVKQFKNSFPINIIKTIDCFDIIHCEVWGRYDNPSTTSSHYFLNIVDDFSTCTWIYFMSLSLKLVNIYKSLLK